MKKPFVILAFLVSSAMAQFLAAPSVYPRIVADTLSDTALLPLQIPPYVAGTTARIRSITVDELAQGVAARIDSFEVTCNAGLNCDSTGTGNIMREDSPTVTGALTGDSSTWNDGMKINGGLYQYKTDLNPPTMTGPFLTEHRMRFTTNNNSTQHSSDQWSFVNIDSGVTYSGSLKLFIYEALRNQLAGVPDDGVISNDMMAMRYIYGHNAATASKPHTNRMIGVWLNPTLFSGTVDQMIDLYISGIDGYYDSVTTVHKAIYQESQLALNEFRGDVVIGGDSPVRGVLSISRETNAELLARIKNPSGGTGAVAGWTAINNSDVKGGLLVLSSGYTPAGYLTPNLTSIYADQDMAISTNAAYPIKFNINSTEAGRFTSTGVFNAKKGFAADGLNPTSGPVAYFMGDEAEPGCVIFYADQGDEHADVNQACADTNGVFKFQSRASGAFLDLLSLNGSTRSATFSGAAITAAGTTTAPSIRLPSGVAETSCVAGGMYYDGTHFYGCTATGVYAQLDN